MRHRDRRLRLEGLDQGPLRPHPDLSDGWLPLAQVARHRSHRTAADPGGVDDPCRLRTDHPAGHRLDEHPLQPAGPPWAVVPHRLVVGLVESTLAQCTPLLGPEL